MTGRNAPDPGRDEGHSSTGRGDDERIRSSASSYAHDPARQSRPESQARSRSWLHDDPPPQEPSQRTGSRHWMRDPEPPRMDFGAGASRGEPGMRGAEESHAGYGDYGTRDYDPRPEPHQDVRGGRGQTGGGEHPNATRPRDFRDYGRGDYRGNVGPGGFGYAESNYGPTRYREAFGEAGREGENLAPRDLESERREGERQSERRSHAGRGPRNYKRSDERIRETLCERLTDDPYVDASDVSVEVKDGVVTLSGNVPDRRMKHRIEDIAADVAGDREIRNEVRVRR